MNLWHERSLSKAWQEASLAIGHVNPASKAQKAKICSMTSSLSPFFSLSAIITKVVMSYILKKKISYEFPRAFFIFSWYKRKRAFVHLFFLLLFFFKVWTFSTACLPTMTRGREMNAGSRHCTEHRHTQIIQYSPWCEVSVVPPPPSLLPLTPPLSTPSPPKKPFSSHEVSSWTRTGYKPLHTTRPSTLYELTTRGFTKATGWCWISPGPS